MLQLQLGPEDPLTTRLEPRAEKDYGLLGFEPVYFWLERVDNRLSDCPQSGHMSSNPFERIELVRGGSGRYRAACVTHFTISLP